MSLIEGLGCRGLVSHDRLLERRAVVGWRTSPGEEVLVVVGPGHLVVGGALQGELRDKYGERHLAASGRDGCRVPNCRVSISVLLLR